MTSTPWTADALVAKYDEVRSHTERLAAPLSPEDQTIQSMPDVSPTKWHRAHVTWFFETFVLADHEPGFAPFQDAYWFLFNSYYEAVGPSYARAQRGVISRPAAPRGAPPSASRTPESAHLAWDGKKFRQLARVWLGGVGLLLMTEAGTQARHLGIDSSIPISLLGLALLGYGPGPVLLLQRGVAAATGRVLAGLDAAWVAATAALLVVVGHRFTSAGTVATVGTGLMVGVLGWWQRSAARRTQASVPGSVQIQG